MFNKFLHILSNKGEEKGNFPASVLREICKKNLSFPRFHLPLFEIYVDYRDDDERKFVVISQQMQSSHGWDGKRGGWKYSRLRHGWLANLGKEGNGEFPIGRTRAFFSLRPPLPPPSFAAQSIMTLHRISREPRFAQGKIGKISNFFEYFYFSLRDTHCSATSATPTATEARPTSLGLAEARVEMSAMEQMRMWNQAIRREPHETLGIWILKL